MLPRQVISVCAVRSIPSVSYDYEIDIMLHCNSTDSPCALRQHLMSFMLNKTAGFCFSTHFLLFFLKPTTAQEKLWQLDIKCLFYILHSNIFDSIPEKKFSEQPHTDGQHTAEWLQRSCQGIGISGNLIV